MHFLLILICLLLWTVLPGHTILYDTLSKTEFIYDSTWLDMTIQDLNYISPTQRITGYYRNGNKAYEYNEHLGFVYFDTMREWNEAGHLTRMTISDGNGNIEIDFDGSSGMIRQRGQNIAGHPDTSITIRDSTGYPHYQSAMCDSICVFPVGVWYTFHENGYMESEGSYLPCNMMEFEYAEYVLPGEFGGDGQTLVIVAVGTYVRVRDGKWTFYDMLGKIIREEYYEGGLLKSTLRY